MAETRSRHDWAQTSHLLALLYNINRKPNSRALKPSDFDPHGKARKQEQPRRQVSAAELQLFFPEARAWKMGGR